MAQDSYADAYGYPYDVGADLRAYMGDAVPSNETSVSSYPMGGEGTAGFHYSGTDGTNHQPHLQNPPLVRSYRIPYTQSNDLPFLPTLTTAQATVRPVPVNPVITGEVRQMFLARPSGLVAGSVAVPIHTSFTAGDPPLDMQVYSVESSSVDTAQASEMYWTPNNSNIDPSPEEEPQLMAIGLGAWKCMVCGLEFRRKQRAAVHFWNKHRNMRLGCSGRCGDRGCDKSYVSRDGLEAHLNPVLARCDSCGKSLLKRNLHRHQEGYCHRVDLPHHNQGAEDESTGGGWGTLEVGHHQ